MPDESIIDKLPTPKLDVYFDAKKAKYWVRTGERYTPFNKDDTIMRLAGMGFSRKKPGGELSQCEKEIQKIQDGVLIDFAGEIAGLRTGFVSWQDRNFLVTSAPRLATPVRGNWDTIEFILNNLITEEQRPYFLGWHKVTTVARYTGSNTFGQLVVFAGTAGCGKSLWQNRVITPLLGGRMAKPLQFMSGGTTFNEDLIRAEHLMLEDENSNMDLKSRRALGAAFKNFTVNPYQRIHPKGQTAFTVPSWHRVSLSVNDEPENLAILPPIDESIKDKVMIFHCRNEFKYPPGVEGREQLEAAIAAELPAFIWYLLNEHSIPEELKSERYGVKEYADPEILKTIHGLAPEAELLYMIDTVLFHQGHTYKERVLPAAEIQNLIMQEPATEHQARKLFNYCNSCGQYLSRLARTVPHRVQRGGVGHGSIVKWKLIAP
jgi:hypothetical protein